MFYRNIYSVASLLKLVDYHLMSSKLHSPLKIDIVFHFIYRLEFNVLFKLFYVFLGSSMFLP